MTQSKALTYLESIFFGHGGDMEDDSTYPAPAFTTSHSALEMGGTQQHQPTNGNTESH